MEVRGKPVRDRRSKPAVAPCAESYGVGRRTRAGGRPPTSYDTNRFIDAGCRARPRDHARDPRRILRWELARVLRFPDAAAGCGCAAAAPPAFCRTSPLTSQWVPLSRFWRQRTGSGLAADPIAGAARRGLVSIATGAYAISAAIALAGGLDFWQTMALSLLMSPAASQFGLIGVVAGGATEVRTVQRRHHARRA